MHRPTRGRCAGCRVAHEGVPLGAWRAPTADAQRETGVQELLILATAELPVTALRSLQCGMRRLWVSMGLLRAGAITGSRTRAQGAVGACVATAMLLMGSGGGVMAGTLPG